MVVTGRPTKQATKQVVLWFGFLLSSNEEFRPIKLTEPPHTTPAEVLAYCIHQWKHPWVSITQYSRWITQLHQGICLLQKPLFHDLHRLMLSKGSIKKEINDKLTIILKSRLHVEPFQNLIDAQNFHGNLTIQHVTYTCSIRTRHNLLRWALPTRSEFST